MLYNSRSKTVRLRRQLSSSLRIECHLYTSKDLKILGQSFDDNKGSVIEYVILIVIMNDGNYSVGDNKH